MVSVVGRGGNVWVVVAVALVLAGVFAAVLGARAVAHSDAERARLASHLASTEIASTLKLAIQHEEDLVVSASAFISGDPHASAADFDRWAGSVHAMRRYPELQNIGLVVLVASSRLQRFEAWMTTHPVRALGEALDGARRAPAGAPGGEAAPLLHCGGRAGEKRRQLPARRFGLLRVRPRPVRDSRLGAGAVRAVQRRYLHRPRHRDAGVPRRDDARDRCRPAQGVRGMARRAARAPGHLAASPGRPPERRGPVPL